MRKLRFYRSVTHTHPVDENGAMRLQRWPDKIICSLIFCFIFAAVLAAEEESRSSYIIARENKRLHGYAVKRIDSTDGMACSQACLSSCFGRYSMMVKRIFYNSMNPHLTEDSGSSFQTENGWEGHLNCLSL